MSIFCSVFSVAYYNMYDIVFLVGVRIFSAFP